MKERTSFSVISRSIQRRGNVETGRKERVLSTGYTRKSTVTELIILASTRPQTNPPCDRYSIFATTRWHVYGNIRDVVTRRPNIRPGPWTFQLIIQRVDLNKSTDQSPIFLTLFIRFSANRARNLSLAPNVFHAIPRPINKTRRKQPRTRHSLDFLAGFEVKGKNQKERKGKNLAIRFTIFSKLATFRSSLPSSRDYGSTNNIGGEPGEFPGISGRRDRYRRLW